MLNKYPLWKYLLILFVISIGVIYAMPNLYAPDPAVQVTGDSSTLVIDEATIKRATNALDEANIAYFGEVIEKGTGLIRLKEQEQQLSAKSVIQNALGHNYVVALNLAPTTPEWLDNLGAGPMKLGLDLKGGVHFLMEVDVGKAVARRLDTYESEIKKNLRSEKIRYLGFEVKERVVIGKFKSAEARDRAKSVIASEFTELIRNYEETDNGLFLIKLTLPEANVKEIEDDAVTQNLTTLRNRVNELGVAEPIVQRQGRDRIVVQLPGVQDTAQAKKILGKTATLEFRLEAESGDSPAARETFRFRKANRGQTSAKLKREIIIKGESVANARSSFDENGRPQVNITLDSQGGTRMHRVTRDAVGQRLGVLFIETKSRTVKKPDENGKMVPTVERYEEKHIISLATIQSALGTQFRTTGLDSTAEASELALLLRAGALAAPIYFVEERTVGPSLGAENIRLGVVSVQYGLMAVLVFMLVWYRVFGLAANIALALNLVLLVAFMSMLSATLTLPGIAGIVLTVGMAVDANVLIFARIREELRNGLPPQAAINAGYDRAFVTILDANLTTLIVAVILYAVGTGPVKGFAVTLSVGILTSMFTAIMVTRAIVNLIYGGRKVEKLWI